MMGLQVLTNEELKSELQKLDEEFGLVKNKDNEVITSSVKVAEIYGKRPADVKARIEKFIELIPELGERNFSLANYSDEQGKLRPCYTMDRQGFSMLVNKFTGDEATIFTYKYTQAFEKMINIINLLLERNAELKEDNKELHSIATSDKDLAARQYQADKVKYALRNVTQILKDSTYAMLETEIDKIVDVHSNLKAKDRYKSDRKMSNAEYKNKVRKYVSIRLEDILSKTRDTLKIAVGTQVNVDLQKGIIETTNRSTGKLLAHRDKNIDMLEDELENSITYPRESEFISIDCHGFSNNYMYRYTGDGTFKTYSYNNWINLFPVEQVPDIDYWEDVDFAKPVEVILHYVAKPDMDIRNMDKSIIDMLITTIYGYDDNIVDSVISKRVGVCDKFEDGKIAFFIRNI